MAYELTLAATADWLHATITGRNSIGNVDTYMKEVFDACWHAECSKLLIEERLEGPRLSMLDVFKVASKRAEAARGHLMAIAYVDHYAEGDQMKFAETVARNRGSNVKVLPTVADAEVWLKGCGSQP